MQACKEVSRVTLKAAETVRALDFSKFEPQTCKSHVSAVEQLSIDLHTSSGNVDLQAFLPNKLRVQQKQLIEHSSGLIAVVVAKLETVQALGS